MKGDGARRKFPVRSCSNDRFFMSYEEKEDPMTRKFELLSMIAFQSLVQAGCVGDRNSTDVPVLGALPAPTAQQHSERVLTGGEAQTIDSAASAESADSGPIDVVASACATPCGGEL